jgi:hypothetical protein
MKTQQRFATGTGVTVMAALLAVWMPHQTLRADWHRSGSIHRSAHIDAHGWRGGGHVDVNRSFHRDVDVHGHGGSWDVHRDIHRDVDIDVHNHDHFWGGVAVGAATTLAVGAVVRSLPPTHTTVVVANQPYYYDAGVYYKTAPSGGYVAVAAPLGAVVAVVPPGSVPVVLGNQTYFYQNGVYYQQQGTTFIVAPVPIGVVVPTLPPGSQATVINGQTYFNYQGITYQPVFMNGATSYMTVKI